jgi:hypothetical protein
MTDNQHAAGPPALELRGIGKRFGHINALSDVDLTAQAGQITETYNPSRWDWGNERQQWERRTASGRSAQGRWSIGSRTGGITPEQDRAFLLRQGPKPRGVIGAGTFVSGAYKDDHWDEDRPGELANYADIRWDTILSDDDLLPVADIEAQVPGLPWSSGIQGSGFSCRPLATPPSNGYGHNTQGQDLPSRA